MTILTNPVTAPYTLCLYQGSVEVAAIYIVPGMTESELGHWVEKHIKRAELDLRKIADS